jgi:hypothetical protein
LSGNRSHFTEVANLLTRPFTEYSEVTDYSGHPLWPFQFVRVTVKETVSPRGAHGVVSNFIAS